MQNRVISSTSTVLSSTLTDTSFDYIFQKNPLPMLIVDRDLFILAANDSYRALFFEPETNTKRRPRFLDGLPQTVRSFLFKNHERRLAKPDSVPAHYRVDPIDKNGGKHACIFYINFISSSQESIISIVDITPSLNDTANQPSDQEEDNTPFYQSPVIAFITKPDGTIEESSQSFLEAAGLHRETLKGRLWTDFVIDASPNLHHDILEKLTACSMLENLETSFYFSAQRPKERLALLSARLIQFRGEPRVIFTVNDISGISMPGNDLFHMEELKVASEIAAGVGHEIRNPMTAVRGFLQCLSKKADFAHYQNYFQLMISELDRANHIITEYLSLTKVKAPRIVIDNLNAIIRQILPLLQINALASNKTILLELAPLADFPVNSEEIRQLLLNLVKNGLEAMDEGKSLTIRTYHAAIDTVVLEVKDEGCGIPEELLKKIGTPFFTTKANGTGLGLSICYTIAEKNHAAIDVKSSDRGTTFSIAFKIDRS